MASTRPSAPPLNADPGPSSVELRNWLTHDLRVKGAASGSNPPQPVETRPSTPAALDAPEKEQSEFARWLMSDVRPRASAVPEALAPVRQVEPASSAGAGLLAPPGEPRSAGSVAPDSLAPLLVSVEEGAPTAPPDLDDDDFSVLPGRRKTRALLGRRSLVPLGLVLLSSGFFLMRTGAPAADPGEESASAAPMGMTGVLPPPPPEQVPFEAEPDPDEEWVEAQPVGAPRRASAEGEAQLEPADSLDPADPRWRLGGPSKARFPDLPLPTLSRLAKDELEQARQRDAAARDAKKKRPRE